MVIVTVRDDTADIIDIFATSTVAVAQVILRRSTSEATWDFAGEPGGGSFGSSSFAGSTQRTAFIDPGVLYAKADL